MDQVDAVPLRMPADEEISHVIDVSLSIVDFYLNSKASTSARPLIKSLRCGIEIPATISRAILLCTPLSNLEAAGLLQSTEPALPTVECALTYLRKHLTENPKQFWLLPGFGLALFNRVWEAYSWFDWGRLDDATVAVEAIPDEAFLDALANLLLGLRIVELPELTIPDCAEVRRTSMFARLNPRRPGRQHREARIEFGAEGERRTLFVRISARRTWRADFEFLSAETKRLGIDFDLSWKDYEDQMAAKSNRVSP